MLYLTAYPLSVKSLPGRKWLSIFFIITMYFGGGMVPTYLVVKQTGLINNMWSLFLPGGVMVYLKLFRSPVKMLESANTALYPSKVNWLGRRKVLPA